MTGYRYLTPISPWTNNTSKFAVVVGSSFSRSLADGAVLFQVQDGRGVIVDAVVVVLTTVTAVGEEFEVQFLPRRMLVPPGGVFTNNSVNSLQVVICDFDEDDNGLSKALAVL